NTDAARKLAVNIGDTDIDPAIEQSGAAGDAARKAAAAMLSTFAEQFASIGVQLGARYDGSAILAEDGPVPADSLTTYTPTSVPGGRAPHIWLDGGRGYGNSLYDRLGAGFTLLRLGSHAPDGAAIVSAAAKRRIPLKVLNTADADAHGLYGRDLVLIRPDHYVAWRGNRPPADCDALLARLTGH